MMHRQFINSCLSSPIRFFATNSSLFFNFLAICCAIFSEESIPQFQFKIHKLKFTLSLSLFEPDQPNDSPVVAVIVEIRVRDWFHNIRISLFPISCPFLLQPQVISSELRILLEQVSQLSVQGRHGDFSFQAEFAHFPNLDLLFLSKESTLAIDSLPRTSFLVAGPHVSAKPWVYHTCWYLLRATAGCRLLLKTAGECDSAT